MSEKCTLGVARHFGYYGIESDLWALSPAFFLCEHCANEWAAKNLTGTFNVYRVEITEAIRL